MPFFKKIIFLTIISIFTSGAYGQKAIASSLEPSDITSFSSLDLTRQVLDNGLVIIVKKVKSTSMVSLTAFVDVGSASEGEFSGSGISHLVEHMLFKGTAALKPGDIEKKIKSYGGNINGFTSYDFTGYQAVVQGKYLDDTLDIINSMLRESAFDPREFEKEKEVIINEINLNRDDPQWQLQTLFNSTAYTTHPYRLPIIGYEPIFRGITYQQALDFYRQAYAPNRTILVVCGDIDIEKTIFKIEEIFRSWASNFSFARTAVLEPKQLNLRKVNKPVKVELTHILLGFHTVSLQDEDMYPLDILASILGNKKSSRLNQEVHKKQGLVHYIEAESFTPRDNGVFTVYAQTNPPKANAAISSILKEIDKVKNGKIKKKELEKAKDEVLSNYLFSQERIQSWSYHLASDELLTHDLQFSKKYVEKIKLIKLEDLKKAARKYFSMDNLTIVTIFPEEAKIVSEQPQPEAEIDKEKIEKFILSNGLIVLLKENHQLPIVSIKANFLGGLRVENESNNGLSNLTSAMLLAGTKSKTAKEISELIEDKGGSISAVSGSNSFGVSIDLLKDHLEAGLSVLCDILINANFPEEELIKEKEKILAQIKNQNDDIFQVASNLFKETLYQSHPYRFPIPGKEETVKSISRGQVINFYKNYITSRNGVLAIFGDIDKKKTLSLIEKHFKNLKAGLPPESNPPVEAERNALTQAIKFLNKEQAVVLLGFKTIKIDDEDKYSLEVLSGIISGGGGRLFTEIRDNLGLAYTLGAYSVPGLDRGYYIFYAATTLENKEKVKELLFKEIDRLKTDYVSEEDLRLSKDYLIGQSQLSWQTNSSLANQAALDELYGLGFNNYQKYASEIEKVTKEEVKEVVAKYFNLENAALVVISPE